MIKTYTHFKVGDRIRIINDCSVFGLQGIITLREHINCQNMHQVILDNNQKLDGVKNEDMELI